MILTMFKLWQLPLVFTLAGVLLSFPLSNAPAQTAPQIAEKALAATVSLEMRDGKGAVLFTGSGFFVRPNLIATNYHVIEGAARGTAKLVDRHRTSTIEGITAIDKTNDLALLKVTMQGIKSLSLGDSDTVLIGETVFVAGNPMGLEGTISEGIISSRRDVNITERFQMTAPISPGSSGGPVLNRKGQVIGVSVASYHGLAAQNLNFAIPSNYLKTLLAQSGTVKTFYGVKLRDTKGNIVPLPPPLHPSRVKYPPPEKETLPIDPSSSAENYEQMAVKWLKESPDGQDLMRRVREGTVRLDDYMRRREEGERHDQAVQSWTQLPRRWWEAIGQIPEKWTQFRGAPFAPVVKGHETELKKRGTTLEDASLWDHAVAGATVGGNVLWSTVTETVQALRDLTQGQLDLYQLMDLISIAAPPVRAALAQRLTAKLAKKAGTRLGVRARFHVPKQLMDDIVRNLSPDDLKRLERAGIIDRRIRVLETGAEVVSLALQLDEFWYELIISGMMLGSAEALTSILRQLEQHKGQA